MREGATCAESERGKGTSKTRAAKGREGLKDTHSKRMVSVASGMQNLHCNFPALSMNGTRHNVMLLYLMSKAQLRSEGTYPPREIGSDPARDNEAYATSRAFSKIYLQKD